MRITTVLSTLLCAGMLSCASHAYAGSITEGQQSECMASWYGPGFDGRDMANGQPYNSNHPTRVAHSTLPMGTIVEVTNLNNGESVIAEVTDRGPNGRGGFCVDATREIAKDLGFYVNEHAGEAPVRVEVLVLPSG